ncbi:21555_t:CDS:2, partial [Rhizophagus irregularis]
AKQDDDDQTAVSEAQTNPLAEKKRWPVNASAVTWRVIRDFTVVQWRKEDPRKYYTSFLTHDMLIGEELLRRMRRDILESR